MTDHYNALTVILDHNMHEDDGKRLIEAIKQMKGVLEVAPRVASPQDAIATARARQKVIEKVWKAITEE
jgi:CheY-like chemotaxis protein